MKKTHAFIVTVLLVIAMLAGCASNTTSSSTGGDAGSDATKKPVKLQFSIWGNDTHKAMYEQLVTQFKEIYPHVDIEIMSVPFAEYQQKISIMMASKTGPDVGWLAERMIPQFLESGQLLDVASDLKADADYRFDDIYPSTLDLYRDGDKLYGVPFSTPPLLMFYNKTLFLEKGLKTPTELYQEGRWTYDEFLQAAAAITDRSKGVYGVKLHREWKNWSDPLLPLFWSHGADMFTEDGAAFALNTDEGRAALSLYHDMIFEDEVHPKPGDEVTFDTGKLGMYTDRYSYVSNAREVQDFEWDIAPLPSGPEGRKTSLGYAGYSVFSDTEHPEEAKAFLKFVTNAESMGVTAQYFVPSRKSILESDIFMKSAPQPSPESIQIAVLDQMSEARIAPGHPNWQQIDVKIQTMLDYLYTQSESAEQVLRRMEEEVNPLMRR